MEENFKVWDLGISVFWFFFSLFVLNNIEAVLYFTAYIHFAPGFYIWMAYKYWIPEGPVSARKLS